MHLFYPVYSDNQFYAVHMHVNQNFNIPLNIKFFYQFNNIERKIFGYAWLLFLWLR